MASVNKVIIIGNLGQDPEKKVTGTGQAVTTLNIATSEKWNDKSGQRQEKTEWHRVVVWGPQAENCAQYLSKGRQVYIEGRLQTRSWDDKDGNKRYTTEVVAQVIQFLGKRSDGVSTGQDYKKPEQSNSQPSAQEDSGPPPFDADDDIPF